MKLLIGVFAAAFSFASGSIGQLPGASGCVTQSGNSGCARGRALANPFATAVSPDGRNVYVSGGVGSLGAIGAFKRNAKTGALTELAGRAGCVFRFRSRVCGTGRGLETPAAIAVSRDGKLVVTAAVNGHAIGVYRRSVTGSLTAAGCFQTRAQTGCREAPALTEAAGLAFSPNGKLLAVAGGSAGLSLFRYSSGGLTWLACVNRSATSGCAKATGPFAPVAVAFNKNSNALYAVSGGGRNGSLSVFALDANGDLSQTQCFAQGFGAEACTPARALEQAAAVAVAPDGFVYVASTVSSAVAVFQPTPNGLAEVSDMKTKQLAEQPGSRRLPMASTCSCRRSVIWSRWRETRTVR